MNAVTKNPSCHNTIVSGIGKTWLLQLWKVSPSAHGIVNEAWSTGSTESKNGQSCRLSGDSDPQVSGSVQDSDIFPQMLGKSVGRFAKQTCIIAAVGTTGWWHILLEKNCFKSQCVNIEITEHSYLASKCLWGHPHDGTSSSIQLSRSLHLCLLTSNTALFRAPTSKSHYTGHACQICQLTNGRAGWPAEIPIKEGSPDCEAFFNAPIKYRAHQGSSTSRQEGRDYDRLPGHDASWTGHCITQQNTTPDCPATMPHGPGTTHLGTVRYLAPQPWNYICSSRCNTPWTYDQPTTHPVYVIARCRPDISPPRGNPVLRLQPTSLGKAQWYYN